MSIKKATTEDMDRIMEIYRSAQDFMIRSGNPTQWGHFYPTQELLAENIRQEACYVLTQEREIHGVFVLRFGEEPAYRVIEDGQWPNDAPYVTIHRLASDGSVHGVFRACVEFCLQQFDNVRVDTHADNLPMRRAIENFGFQRCGIIHVANGTPRIAYQYSAETEKLARITCGKGCI